VAGVTAPGFRGIDLALQSDYWLPLGMAPQVLKTVPDRDSRTTSWLSVTARLRPGVTRAQAESELEMLGARLTKAFPSAYTQLHFRTGETGILMPAFKSQVMMFLGALLVVVLLVLLIACTNVANLLLAQANARRKEIAVRLALGASRGQIMRQMFVESLLLALAGGLAGVVISIWAVQALAAFRLPLPIPIAVDLAIDWRVLGWTCCLSLGSGLLFGLAPALAAGRVALTGALKGEDAFSGASRRWNVRHALVFGQVALSMLLLCATGLFLRSLGEARSIPIGFRASGLSLLSVDPMASGYSRERTVALLQEIERRAAALPGVESAAFTDLVPLSIGGSSSTLTVEGVRQQPAGNRSADFFLVSPSYFRTLGVPLIAGRGFAGETSPQRFAVVNETLVKRLFEGHNPIGRRVRSGQDSYEIIGVVKDTKSRTIGEAPRAVMYRQISQDLTRDAGFLGFTLITKAPPGLLPALRKEIRSLDPNLPVQRVETIEEHLRNALFLPRLAGSLFGIFGVTGLLLASVGLYGVMSYSVSRRTREIGIRMALGAEVSTVRAMVVNQGMLIAGAAMVVGLAAALAAAKLAAGILYGIQPHDPLTFVMVTGSLGFIALLACWIPARRAARVQPITALRYE
jgi:predicted permease